MSVYLFTYHAHGPDAQDSHSHSLMTPDRPQGYAYRGCGIETASSRLAKRYRNHMRSAEVTFDPDHQRKLIDLIIDSQPKQTFRCLGIATDATHLHALVAWVNGREPAALRAAIRSPVTRGMNQEFGRQQWLSEGDQKRVRNRTHFDYLVESFLPKHSGLVWTAYGGFVRSVARRAG